MENKVNYIEERTPESLLQYYKILGKIKKTILREINEKPTKDLYGRLKFIESELQCTADELLNSSSFERKIRR